jgi:hypothetical protein
MHVLRCIAGNVEIMDDHMFILIEKSYKRYIGVLVLSLKTVRHIFVKLIVLSEISIKTISHIK